MNNTYIISGKHENISEETVNFKSFDRFVHGILFTLQYLHGSMIAKMSVFNYWTMHRTVCIRWFHTPVVFDALLGWATSRPPHPHEAVASSATTTASAQPPSCWKARRTSCWRPWPPSCSSLVLEGGLFLRDASSGEDVACWRHHGSEFVPRPGDVCLESSWCYSKTCRHHWVWRAVVHDHSCCRDKEKRT